MRRRDSEREGEKSSLGCCVLMPVQSVDCNTKVGVVIK